MAEFVINEWLSDSQMMEQVDNFTSQLRITCMND